MRCAPAQLEQALTQGLAPVYLLFGDEPLQLGEAADAIRRAARDRGFSERTRLEHGQQFDWSSLAAEAGALSLFAERRLIELRISGDGVGREGSDALRRYCERVSDDVLLLILAPGLDWKTLKSKWAEALERVGVIVQVRLLQGQQLHQWLRARLQAAGFQPTPEAVALLAERVEGHLLAGAQEIEKLRLLCQPGPLDAESLLAAVTDSARYSLFDLTDAALAGDRVRADRVLRGLATEGTAEPLVLWVLAREIRKLAAVAFALAQRQDLAPVLRAHQVFDSRRQAVITAARRYPLPHLWSLLERCAEADLAIKGQHPADPWTLLTGIAEGLAAAPGR
ncbi:DNA polymerase III subunit delta [Thiohalocapsa marina]|uniref:DNA polymerase III subunit delta n=1 Tax=Thiohalocapsa marina TaxID=424902 RepID=A0A5M8FVN7_9GAMM|nr:DNA polymerase III subunit delta [Thiohalocapsa marina]KAA6187823.1 DNA polymerase III subunit delta [Thiohalocapsa marina]